MKIYVHTITEKCPVQVWEDGLLSFSADKGTKGWNDIQEGK